MENREKKFNKLMESQGLEELTKKPKEVWVARFRELGSTDSTIIEEFSSKEEFEAWYDAVGRGTEEGYDGKIEVKFGPSELGQVEE